MAAVMKAEVVEVHVVIHVIADLADISVVQLGFLVDARDDGYDDEIDGFIDTYEGDHQGNRGTWKRLNTFGEFYAVELAVDVGNILESPDAVGLARQSDVGHEGVGLPVTSSC